MEYVIAGAKVMKEMRSLLAQCFIRRDPPAVAMGITADEFQSMVSLYSDATVRDGLTLIARSPATGKLAGALLVEDAASTPPEGLAALSPKFFPIFELLGRLYKGIEPPAKNERLHLFLLGVDQAFAGQGIATHLVLAAMKNGAEKGYRSAMAEATNPISQRVFRKLGFCERARQSYEDFLYEGQPVFAGIADAGGPILVEKELIPGGSQR